MNNPWNAINPPPRDVNARRVDHTHALELFWARDHIGRYLFIYEFSSEASPSNINLPDLVGIEAIYAPADNSITVNRLILLLKEQSNWEIFLSLCNDLVQATREAKNSTAAVQLILRRLVRWQDFLKKNRSSILSEEGIKGLIGELLFIKDYLIPTFGAGQAIKYWQGPEGLPQDFNINNSAIEVKCQSGATSPYIKITSADQLCPQLPEMYLFVVTLGKTDIQAKDAINLPHLVFHIKEILRSDDPHQLERFNDLLYMVGYMDSDRYLDFSYVVTQEKMFQVENGFPRICPEEIHRGIVNLSYSISLSECSPFEKQPHWMKAKS
jgi:hypothetical protein